MTQNDRSLTLKFQSKKQQQQQQTPTQMHPNIMPQGGMQAQGAMHPDFYMMQQGGQQRVPPIHMASSQMQQVSFI